MKISLMFRECYERVNSRVVGAGYIAGVDRRVEALIGMRKHSRAWARRVAVVVQALRRDQARHILARVGGAVHITNISAGACGPDTSTRFHGTVGHHNKSGEIAGFTSKAIRKPASHGRTSPFVVTGIHHPKGRVVVEIFVMQTSDHGDVVGVFLHVSEAVADLGAGFTAPGERESTAQKFLLRDVGKGRLYVVEGRGRPLAVQIVQYRFGVKRVHLAWAAVHKQPDDVFRRSPIMRCPG